MADISDEIIPEWSGVRRGGGIKNLLRQICRRKGDEYGAVLFRYFYQYRRGNGINMQKGTVTVKRPSRSYKVSYKSLIESNVRIL
jgi:hypothetical protein